MSDQERANLLAEAYEYHATCTDDIACTLNEEVQRIKGRRMTYTQTIHRGDCIEVMRGMEDSSIDAIVTDPPYGLGFMGKAWDLLPPGEEWAAECLRVLKPGGHLLAFGGTRTWHRLAVAVEDAGFEIRDSIAWMYGTGFPKSLTVGDGRGTALKPAFEPVVVGRKPLVGTVAQNVTAHGVGALNIDPCRVEGHVPTTTRGGHAEKHRVNDSHPDAKNLGRLKPQGVVEGNPLGRWPANVVLDESQAGKFEESRFFYVAKAAKSERPIVGGVAHPTVKPLALMRWLVRLVTPDGGLVLDPFAGSGTTVEAALLEGLQVIGIEREAEYLPLIQARIDRTAA